MAKHKKRIALDRRQTLLIGGVVVFLVLALGAGVALQLYVHNLPQNQAGGPGATNGPQLPQSVTTAQQLSEQGKVDDSNKAITQALQNTSISKSERAQLLMQQGANYVAQGDETAAQQSYTQAAQTEQSFEAYKALGDLAVGTDNQQAILYYKKALELLPKDTPISESTKKNLEQDIAMLQGQGTQ